MLNNIIFSTNNVQNQKPKILVHWRVSKKSIINVLEKFATTDKNNNDDSITLLTEIQSFFDELNLILTKQEKFYIKHQLRRYFCSFCDKMSHDVPHLISEMLACQLS